MDGHEDVLNAIIALLLVAIAFMAMAYCGRSDAIVAAWMDVLA